jgi:predicted DNA-binding WGR domain protein
MIKLYKGTKGELLHYHEAWSADATITEHWGKLGESGSTRDHSLTEADDPDDALEAVLASARANGFAELDEDDLQPLSIEYRLEGSGSSVDLSKRHALEDRLNEVLGWVGLGQCEGGKIGHGTMEVCCLVVDFELARRVIEADLAGSAFADYSRIFAPLSS